MIVQCEACQTRFRLADEKVKPGGTKVRCSKCKVVFTVTPPEPEPVEETVDFGSFNMEKVADEPSAEATQPEQSMQADAPGPEEQQRLGTQEAASDSKTSNEPEGSELDFSALESEMGSDTGLGEELADEFSFADTSKLQEDDANADEAESAADFAIGDEPQAATSDEPTDFGDAFAETDEPGGSIEFDFDEDTESGAQATDDIKEDFSSEESSEPSEFSFDDIDEGAQATDDIKEGFSADKSPEPSDFSFDDIDEGAQEQETADEFSFEDEGDATAFSFDDDDSEDASTPGASEEYSEPGEFSFDDEPSEDTSASEWGDDSPSDHTSFDFDEPKFDTDDSPAESPTASSDDEGLQFGEIDFASDNKESEAPSFQSDDDFSKASMEQKEEPEPFEQNRQNDSPPARDYDDEPLPVPPAPKKSSLSRILVLLVLLLVILGGAAGYLFMQEGTLNLNMVTQYLPFLQEYIGETPPSSPGDRIGINITGSSYVESKNGQMLVIQGAAVNNHPATRSSITVKGVLIDDKGQPLLQQTVFCGNQLDDAALKSMPFAAIEEAMNNQFGEGLSNMNIAPGAAIPFTIVFRNLPAGIANINVEVVDSKPGAG